MGVHRAHGNFGFTIKYNCNPIGTSRTNKKWTAEQAGRLYVMVKKLLYDNNSLFQDGAYALCRNRVSSHLQADKKKNRKLSIGQVPISANIMLHMYMEQNGRCAVSRLQMRWDTETRFSVSCDRTFEATKNNEPHTKDNCRLVCRICNNWATWKKETCEGVFLYVDEVNAELSRIKSDPLYNFEDQVMKKLKYLVDKMNLENKKKHAPRFDDAVPELTVEDVLPILKIQEYKCFYSGMNMLPYHANASFQISKERPNPLLPYVIGNIVFVLESLNANDCSSGIFFDDPSKKYKFNDPEIIAWEPRGWSKEIVGEVKAEYAKQPLNESDRSAAVLEARNWN